MHCSWELSITISAQLSSELSLRCKNFGALTLAASAFLSKFSCGLAAPQVVEVKTSGPVVDHNTAKPELAICAGDLLLEVLAFGAE